MVIGQTTPVVELLGDQAYQLTVTAPNGCETVKTIIPQGDPDQTGRVHIQSSAPTFCAGQQIQLTTTFTNYSNNGNRTYQWSNGATNSHTQVNLPGEYRVTVTTSAGCTFVDTILIGEGYEMSIQADNDLACPASPAILSAVVLLGDPQGLTYQWSTEDWTQNITVTEGGDYSVTVTDATGCSLISSLQLAGGVALVLNAATEHLTATGSVDIVPEVTGGASPYQYQWSAGSTAAQLSVNVAGTYGLTVTDAAGCTAIDEVIILPFDDGLCEGIDISILFHEPDCETYGSARLETVVPSGFEVNSYAWSTGATTPDILIDAGNQEYAVTLTAINGCQTVSSLNTPGFQTLNNSSAATALCELVNYLELIPLANDQATLVFDGLSQADLDALFVGVNGTLLEVVAEYQNETGPVIEVVPFVSPGIQPDPATWTGQLFSVPADTEVTLRMQISNSNFCPVTCAATRVLVNPGATDTVEIVLEEDPEILLANYDCGDTFLPDSTTINTDPLIILNEGEIISVNGFPILIKTLVNQASNTGNYTGTGIVPLPFNDRNLLVNFNGKVNKYRTFYDGVVQGMEGDLSSYDFSMDTLSIGGDICIPQEDEDEYDENDINPVTGLDRFGFDSTGVNIYTGTNLDTLGFDQQGNHVVTGDQYNEQGCNREGRDEANNPCSPQRFIDPAAQAFIDSIGSGLAGVVNAQLAAELAAVQTDLQSQTQACMAIRSEMQGLRDSLQFAEPYVYGDSSQYFNPGLSQEFATEPQPFALNGVNRDPRVTRLEDKHILLNSCDVDELILIQKEATILGRERRCSIKLRARPNVQPKC